MESNRIATVSGDEQLDAAAADWSRVAAGPWLAETLEALRHPDALARIEPGDELKTIRRPYQQAGVRRAASRRHIGWRS